MLTRLRCPSGHEWLPAESSSAPLVCPTCGRAPVVPPTDRRFQADAEKTLDDDHTVDLPTPTPAPSVPLTSRASTPAPSPRHEEMTQTFTPPPTPAPSTSVASSNTSQAPTHSSSASVAQLPKPASQPFTILRQHAKGGLGVVSLARDEAIKREVALKQILPQHVDNAILKRRFLYEAQITGQLEHPSIVPVYTLGADDAGKPFYIMRFVKGRTLDEIIKEHHSAGPGGGNPIVFRELLRRFIAVCQAVAYAHSRGIIHRDLKPANVMLGDYGETLVLDWGLAKDIKQAANDPALWGASTPHVTASLSGQTMAAPPAAAGNSLNTPPTASKGSRASVDSAELTMEGQIIGTPAYMAPEQAEGRTDLHAPATDIYALGGILYKILTGHSPQAPTASTTATNGGRRFTFVASPPPAVLDKTVHPLLNTICIRAMATDPNARYPRALEMSNDIQRWLDEHPLSLKPRTHTTRLLEMVKENWIPVLLLLVGLIAVLVTLLIVNSRK